MNRNRFLSAMLACLPALAQGAMHRTLGDAPGRLQLEIVLPATSLAPIAGAEGLRLACGACQGSGTGAPDLPVFAFNVLSGAAEPRVAIEILESESRIVPEGIGAVPAYPSPYRAEYRRDGALYARAAEPNAEVGPVRILRGAKVRGIKVPLALWSEAGKSLTLLKRIRVTADFPDALSRAAGLSLAGTFRNEVMNPLGGAWLAGAEPARALRKAGADAWTWADTLIRISVGDKVPGGQDEDKVYALPFSRIAKLAPGINGAPIRNLRLFAGPEDTLEQAVTGKPSAGSLAEIPVEIVDHNGPNVFDEGDTVIFYGHGTSIWKRLPESAGPIRWRFSIDPYSFENRYYLDFSGHPPGAALRLEVSAGAAPAPPRTSAYHFLHAEKDDKLLACEVGFPPHEDSAAGFRWFWHWNGSCRGGAAPMFLTAAMLADAETEFLKDALRAPGDSLFIGLFAHPYRHADDFRVRLAGSGEAMAPIGIADGQGSWHVTTGAIPPDGRLRIDSAWWGGEDRRFEGYTVAYRRRLVLSGPSLWIFPEVFGSRAAYRVEGGQGASCLRIESGVAVRKIALDAEGVFSDSLDEGANARYLVYRHAAATAPGAVEPETPSNGGQGLRSLESGDGKDPEYLIIAPRALADEAVALMKYRNDGKRALRLKTEVVFAEDIYREYSGGRMSPPAIRDFLRWAYSSWGGKGPGANPLKYVLLFGAGNYDYRGIAAARMRDPPPNHIPPYEFLNGANGAEGMASDDFYGLLDPGDEVQDKAMMELSVGRIPARSPAEAAGYLRKVSDFEDPAKAGAWRGRMTFAADDDMQRGLANNFDGIPQGHTTFADEIARAASGNEPGVTADQVYLLDYPRNAAFHKPEATQDLLSLIDQGTLAVTYVGHGANNQWADEVLLQTNNALAHMSNQGRTPILCSFSCTVGRFESLKDEGMSDRMVMAPDKGAIAAVSATRESYPMPNKDLAVAFYKRLFPPAAAGAFATVGDALREAKNSNEYNEYNDNDTRYALLGEPVLLVRKPQLGVAFTRTPDTLKALDCDVIRGAVEGGSGNGFINLKILAGARYKTWPAPKGSSIADQHAEIRGSILFEGTFPYKQGRFSADYFIPKKIPFGDSTARIVAFAWDATQEREGAAARDSLTIAGVSGGACAEDREGKGPRISITGCDHKESGGLDFPDQVKLALPYCLEIQVDDSTGGILASEGPDEATTLQIPGILDSFHPHPGIDGLYRKVYRFPLEPASVPPGLRLLKVTSRDGYGNSSQRLLRMDLTMDSSLNSVAAYNVPNPMKRGGTTFYFSTVLPARSVDLGDRGEAGDRVEFEIRVYNQSGRLVKIIERANSGDATWDGRDAWGNLQANGVYFYKITARQKGFDADAKPGYRTLSSKRNVLVISR